MSFYLNWSEKVWQKRKRTTQFEMLEWKQNLFKYIFRSIFFFDSFSVLFSYLIIKPISQSWEDRKDFQGIFVITFEAKIISFSCTWRVRRSAKSDRQKQLKGKNSYVNLILVDLRGF